MSGRWGGAGVQKDVIFDVEKIIMEHVEHFLNSLGLGQYVPAFEGNGYDDMGIILNHDDDDFQILGPFLGMYDRHLRILQRAVNEMKNPRTRVSTTNRVPIVQLDGNTTENDGVPTVESAATAAAAATTCAVTATSPTKRKAPSYDLPEFCEDTQRVRLESLRHSTALGSSAMRDNKKSGTRKIVFRCKSMLSKRLRKAMGPQNVEGPAYKCDHCLTWSFRKKRGGFILNRAESVLEHAPHCVAGQHVSRAELLHDVNFVKHTLNETQTTGKQAAKTALGRGGRLDGSVSSRTAKRASNDVKRYHDKDYDEDWSKIRPWGEEYEHLNSTPAKSRFDMQTDDQNRSVLKYLGPRVLVKGLWSAGPWARLGPLCCCRLFAHVLGPTTITCVLAGLRESSFQLAIPWTSPTGVGSSLQRWMLPSPNIQCTETVACTC